MVSLDANDGPNCLHSGKAGFDKVSPRVQDAFCGKGKSLLLQLWVWANIRQSRTGHFGGNITDLGAVLSRQPRVYIGL